MAASHGRRSGEQLYIDGTAPPQVKEVEQAIRVWLDAKANSKDATERLQLRHASLLLELGKAGLEKYAFTDDTGKRKLISIGKEPKVKLAGAPKEPKPRKSRGRKKPEKDDDDAPPPAMGTSDPFASTRLGLVEEAEARQAAIANGEIPTPTAEVPPARRKR